jgi:serine/threonine-protein kinase
LTVGETAELYLATLPGESGFEKKVVIKRLLPALETDEPSKSLFIDEAKLAATLVHPRIAQTFELASQGSTLFVAMEHVDGAALDDLARDLASRQRRLEPQLAAWIAHEILDALDFAHHAHVVHGDLSTSKVLLSARGDVKLVGFGATKLPESEAWRDVFATGVVLAELLTGHRLFAGANDLRIMRLKLERFERCLATVQPALADIVRRALRTATDIRWDAAGFRETLAEWMFEHRHRVTSQQVAALVNGTTSLDALPEVTISRGPAPPSTPYVPRVRKPSIEIPPLQAAVEGTRPGREPRTLVAPKRPSREIPALVVPPRPASAPAPAQIAFEDLGEHVEPASLADAAKHPEPDEFGEFALVSPLRVMFKRMTARATGTLAVDLHGLKKEIYFCDGRPEWVASNVAAEQLGNYLVANGAISNGELSMLLATRDQRGGEISELAVDLCLVTAPTLREHWTALLREAVVDVATWKKGSYSWFSGREPKTLPFRLEASPFELLGAAALRFDDRLVMNQAERKLRASSEPRVDPSCFGLAGMDELFTLLDGTRTIDEVLRRYSDRARCHRMLTLLEACELVAS